MRRAVIAGALTCVATMVLVPSMTVIAEASPSVYWVSPTGSDAGPGTAAAPFATIQHCANTVAAGDTCMIQSGVYRETVTVPVSGTASAPVTFQAATGAQVTIDGSDPVTGWELYSGSIYRASATVASTVQGLQLFQGSAAMVAARWPATGPDLVHQVRATAGTGTTDQQQLGGTIVDPNIPTIAGGWVGATITLWGGAQFQTGTLTVTASSPGHVSWSGAHSLCYTEFTETCAKAGSRYYLSGKLAALQSAGQWFYDPSAGYVYFWAPGGGAPVGVTVKQRNNAFDLSGVSYINIRNVSLFGATITTNASSTHSTLDGISAKYVSQYDTIPDPVPAKDTAAAAHLLDTGIVLTGSFNTLQNSVIDWSAGNGVSVQGTNNTVTNNLIHDVDYMGTFNAGIYVIGQHQSITHNTIFDTVNSGMFATYNGGLVFGAPTEDFTNNFISYNNIFGYGLLNQDLGGFYTCCASDASGGSVDHNWIHDPAIADPVSLGGVATGVYLDAGAGHFTVAHNVTWNTVDTGVFVNGDLSQRPQDNLVYNNTLGTGATTSVRLGACCAPNPVGMVVENNILRAPTLGLGSGATGATQSHNLLSTTDPLFVSPTAADFTLGAGSPAIDAGAVIPGVTDGYNGAAPDEGAYESGSTPWHPGCNLAGCAIPTNTSQSIDDAAATLSGAGWSSTASCASCFSATLTFSHSANDTLTFSFTGTQAQLYGARDTTGGYGGVAIDGGSETLVNWYDRATTPTGDMVMWTSPIMASGTHTVTVRVMGTVSVGTDSYAKVDRLTFTP